MFELDFQGSDRELVLFLRTRAVGIKQAIKNRLDQLSVQLQQHIVREKLSGQVLHHRSGKGQQSIRVIPATEDGERIEGGVQGGGGPAWYMALHEFGGTFTAARKNLMRPPHLVTRTRGERVMTGSPYGIHFPERSFMRSSLQEMRQQIYDGMAQALRDALQE
jgi:hypothetical protein